MKQIKQPTTLCVSGIPVEVCKKKIKHIYLRVKAATGSVSVSAPLMMRDGEIAQFVRAKIGWIYKQLARPALPPRPSERAYASGETLLVWGKSYRLETCHGARYALALTADAAMLTVRKSSTGAQRERFIREWYRGLLKADAARLLPKWEAVTGLHAAGWQTKAMKTRWGTCNIKTGRIWLNVHLAEKPPACLEYVILHELVHLAERRHNERFYALLSRHMPSWREAKAALNPRRISAGEW
ncbi:MAG: SprT family zinc-dependent metalloprotease [Bacillota bacterium]